MLAAKLHHCCIADFLRSNISAVPEPTQFNRHGDRRAGGWRRGERAARLSLAVVTCAVVEGVASPRCGLSVVAGTISTRLSSGAGTCVRPRGFGWLILSVPPGYACGPRRSGQNSAASTLRAVAAGRFLSETNNSRASYFGKQRGDCSCVNDGRDAQFRSPQQK